eukprot:CAMPEP_0202462982 /NCGR_PEP_ID=MMETSP1360-20130828/56209_1 /ASSEMBLY_ACC=CAM_ASM_000848 /TAXON_ID=515479 /ORGANISM="Licmophora paradoxa, Strain CCMP2313" /LENGTH=30 /DNA_ID= /DNA_START= /DNA_END= /DNA_ORIENTATION=
METTLDNGIGHGHSHQSGDITLQIIFIQVG